MLTRSSWCKRDCPPLLCCRIYGAVKACQWLGHKAEVEVEASGKTAASKMAHIMFGTEHMENPLVAGVFGVLAKRLGIEVQEMLQQHSVGYLSMAFDSEKGLPVERMVTEMAQWPLFMPESMVWKWVVDLAKEFVPSPLCRDNLGVWTLWEGRLARHWRLVRDMPGYVALQQEESVLSPDHS